MLYNTSAMFRRKLVHQWIGFIAAIPLLTLLTPLSQSAEPLLTQWTIDIIRSLPYGVDGQSSLILRSKHIEKTAFFGSGMRSEYGFKRQKSIVGQNLWLRLRNRSNGSWASATITFKTPIDVSNYNSIVLWVRPSIVAHKLWIGLQDPTWTQDGLSQIRTEPFPSRGFGRDQTYQASIPFIAFDHERSINWKRISEITFEFGSDTVGNYRKGNIEILGIAFVRQSPPLRRPRYLKALPQVVRALGKKRPVKPKPIAKQKPKPVKPEVAKSIAVKKKPPVVNQKPIQEASAPPVVVKKPTKPLVTAAMLLTFLKWSMWIIIAALLVLLIRWGVTLIHPLVKWMGAHRPKRRIAKTVEPSSKMIQEIRWFQDDGPFSSQDIWKELPANGIKNTWLSPFQLVDKFEHKKGEYYGEGLLRDEIQKAAQMGINVFPSLCFVRTIFHYESFLKDPHLYKTKKVSPQDRHRSDEELRTRNIGYFPIWIPPYWQRVHNLDERVLVAFGKLPGSILLNDSAQYNLNSPQLKEYAVGVLERMAQVSKGVRIEGAVALLNSTMRRYWRLFPPRGSGQAEPAEFWDDVISRIKLKYPDFLFIADGAGSEIRKIRSVGFDYFENNSLVESLVNQIRIGNVGNLTSYLVGERSYQLEESIYRISALVQSNRDNSLVRQKNLLAAVILSLLPGTIQHDGRVGTGFSQFLKNISQISAIAQGRFVVLNTDSPPILAFARWDSRSLYLVVANFSLQTLSANVRLDPFIKSFQSQGMHLFTDVFFGTSFIRDLPTQSSGAPANAVMGRDLREHGLPLNLPGLSLRLLSVNLGSPISHETISDVRQFH